MRNTHLLAVALFVSAAAVASPIVTFPGPVKAVRAPHSAVRVYYVDPGENADGLHEYSVHLGYPDHRSEKIDTFLRSVDVAWSPSGEALYVSNNIGSSVAECTVISVNSKSAHKVSMTGMLKPARFPAATRDFRRSVHGYVICDGWLDSDRLRVVVHGDYGNEHWWKEFRYTFIYDRKRGTAEQISAKRTQLK